METSIAEGFKEKVQRTGQLDDDISVRKLAELFFAEKNFKQALFYYGELFRRRFGCEPNQLATEQIENGDCRLILKTAKSLLGESRSTGTFENIQPQVLSLLEITHQKFPGNPYIADLLASECFNNEDLDKALEVVKETFGITKSYVPLHITLAKIKMAREQFWESAEILFKIRPRLHDQSQHVRDSFESISGRVISKLIDQSPHKSAFFWKRITELFPNKPTLLVQYANIFFHLSPSEQEKFGGKGAEEWILTRLREENLQDPYNPFIANALGIYHLRSGDVFTKKGEEKAAAQEYNAAAQIFERALTAADDNSATQVEENWKNIKLLTSFGKTRFYQGQLLKAEYLLKTAYQLDKKDQVVIGLLSRLTQVYRRSEVPHSVFSWCPEIRQRAAEYNRSRRTVCAPPCAEGSERGSVKTFPQVCNPS